MLPTPTSTNALDDLRQKTTSKPAVKPTIIPGKPDVTGANTANPGASGKHVLVIPAIRDKH